MAAGGGQDQIAAARRAWQESMLRRLDELGAAVRRRPLQAVAAHAGAEPFSDGLRLPYWGETVLLTWPGLQARRARDDQPLSTFDRAMLLYYLSTADGAPMADRWIGFRELPDGAFYNRAFQGYSGDLLARAFGSDPGALVAAGRALGGAALPGLAPAAVALAPLPHVRLAAALWPGDEDFPAKASVLFDAAACHYMTTDGLALLGGGLARRLIKAGSG